VHFFTCTHSHHNATCFTTVDRSVGRSMRSARARITQRAVILAARRGRFACNRTSSSLRMGVGVSAQRPPPGDATDAADDAAEEYCGRHPCQTLELERPGATTTTFRAGVDFNANRWDPVEQNQFLDDRGAGWSRCAAFVRDVVAGRACLSDLTPRGGVGRSEEMSVGLAPARVDPSHGVDERKTKNRKLKRWTWRANLAYHGPSFAGFAWNAACDGDYDGKTWEPGRASVTAVVLSALEPVLDKKRPLPSAGRTDRGVSAAASCVSFWTLKPTTGDEITRLINETSPAGNALRVSDVRWAPDAFHATFAATHRRYVYILPMRQGFNEARTPRASLDASVIDRILAPLVGHDVDMFAFARATPEGKNPNVRFVVARAFQATLPISTSAEADDFGADVDAGIRRSRATIDRSAHGNLAADDDDDTAQPSETDVIVIELIADRFLRRLVRCLVSTAVREAANYAGSDTVLLDIAACRDRKAVAPPAPALGLVFAGVSYSPTHETTLG
jgi:tRNA pseudouridine(38-40) synthase